MKRFNPEALGGPKQHERVILALRAWFAGNDKPPTSAVLAELAGLPKASIARAHLTELRRAGDVVGTRRAMRLAPHLQVEASPGYFRSPRFDLLARREQLRTELRAIDVALAETP